jgi:hypothetical protein
MSVLALGALIALATASVGSTRAPSQPEDASTVDRHLQDDRIVESSGLALSSRHPGVLLTHNDSGDSPRVFAVGRGGDTEAVWTLSGAEARDWEDIATGPNSTVWVGDIGDNKLSRDTIEVYRFTEPEHLQSEPVQSTRFSLAYRDGRHNAEALLVRPRTGRVLIVTKEYGSAGFYRAPLELRSDRVNYLERARSAPDMITAGDFASDGGELVLRNYGSAYAYDRVRSSATEIDLPSAQQGESITFCGDGLDVLTGSEGQGSPVWRVPVP